MELTNTTLDRRTCTLRNLFSEDPSETQHMLALLDRLEAMEDKWEIMEQVRA